MPTAESALRCLQRPTGEWFTFAAGNAPGKDTPDATELLTEAEARAGLQAAGLSPAEVEARLAAARAKPEVGGDELPLPDPAIGGPAAFEA